MKKIKIEYSFFSVAVLLVIIGIVLSISGIGITEIQTGDTYFVVPFAPILFVFSMIVCFLGVIYLLIRRFVNKRTNTLLNYCHFILTTLSFLGMLLPILFLGSKNLSKMHTYNSNSNFIDGVENLNLIITIFGYLFIIAQILFLINIVSTLIKKKTS